MGNIIYGKITNVSGGQQPAPAPQGMEEQRHAFISWFSSIFSGLSSQNEAAFLEALSCLTPAEWNIIGMRLKDLGDPNKADTPEARAFRQAVVLIPDFETRVKVLQKVASLTEKDWLVIASASGAAVAGQIDQAWRLIRDHYGPNLLEKIKAADQGLADAVQGWDPNLGQYTSKLHQWRIQQKEALRCRREAPRSAWRRLGEFFGVLRPLPLKNFLSVSGAEGENGQVP